MAKCQTQGYEKETSRPGFHFCYPCYKSNNPEPEPIDSSTPPQRKSMLRKENEDISSFDEWKNRQRRGMCRYYSQMGKSVLRMNFTLEQRIALKSRYLEQQYLGKLFFSVIVMIGLKIFLATGELEHSKFEGRISYIVNVASGIALTSVALVIILPSFFNRSRGDYFLDNAKPLCILNCEKCDGNGAIGEVICKECNSLGVIFQNIKVGKIAENLVENEQGWSYQSPE